MARREFLKLFFFASGLRVYVPGLGRPHVICPSLSLCCLTEKCLNDPSLMGAQRRVQLPCNSYFLRGTRKKRTKSEVATSPMFSREAKSRMGVQHAHLHIHARHHLPLFSALTRYGGHEQSGPL